jgi:hypothetical protein
MFDSFDPMLAIERSCIARSGASLDRMVRGTEDESFWGGVFADQSLEHFVIAQPIA